MSYTRNDPKPNLIGHDNVNRSKISTMRDKVETPKIEMKGAYGEHCSISMVTYMKHHGRRRNVLNCIDKNHSCNMHAPADVNEMKI